MNLEELRRTIESARWFSMLGQFTPHNDFVRIGNLQAWASAAPGRPQDSEQDAIADDMEWLPSTQSQEDPIHGSALIQLARKLRVEDPLKRARTEFYKTTLDSLGQQMTHSPLLTVGAHDFSDAAKGSALFAVRMAVTEILTGREGFWCSLIPLYQAGFWPCGRLTSGRVVVL